MKVKRIVVGPLAENCYLLEQNNKVLLIDPGDDFPKIKKELDGKTLLKILITHEHFDHIGAVYDIIKEYKVDVLSKKNLKEGHFNIEDFSLEIIETPGHTSDSITYFFEKENKMFVGDFLFLENIGRCDLPTGSFKEMQKSIEKIKTYSEKIEIYPGHGDTTTLEHEKKHNPYF